MDYEKIEDAIIVICSTPNSKRLPNKVFKYINGLSALEHLLNRLRKQSDIDIFLAIPEDIDEKYRNKYSETVGLSNNIKIFEGDNDNPLKRTLELLSYCNKIYRDLKYIIRITHDDILIDIETMNNLLNKVREENAGYGYSPSIIEGAGVEVIAIENLIYAYEKNEDKNIEHISYFVKGNSCPNPKIVEFKPRQNIQRNYRLTLDYYEDFVVLETIFRKLGNTCSIDQICSYLDMNYEILNYNKMPLISFYTCVYNCEKYILDCMSSVVHSMEYINAEYIIIDDYSTDNTLNKILSSGYIKNISKLILNDDNIGLASSSNIAINNCKGEYVMRVDADDRLIHDSIQSMMKFTKEFNCDIVYAPYYEIDEDRHLYSLNPMLPTINHHAGCALMHKKWINEIRFKEGIKHWDSLELWKRISLNSVIGYYEIPTWLYRVHDQSLSRNNIQERNSCKP